MAEVEATIPENSESIAAPETNEVAEPAQVPEPAEPKRGRGRPAGARDKAPRTTKPKVRVEPIPTPVPKASATAPAAGALPGRAPPVVEHVEAVEAVEARAPTPEPPSPRTLYRQTSAHLLMQSKRCNEQPEASLGGRAIHESPACLAGGLRCLSFPRVNGKHHLRHLLCSPGEPALLPIRGR